MKLFVKQRKTFADPESGLEDGIVDVSDDLSVERLLEAYSFGIFPWPHDDFPTLWFCPPQRGILEFADFHVPRSVEKLFAKKSYEFTWNRRFDEVIEACAVAPRVAQAGTWITPKINLAFKKFHRAGYAHSLECWLDGKLVGGLYGVYVGGVFSGESMFHRESGASKFCLMALVSQLSALGLTWIDIQMVTPLLKGFGGKYVSRSEYLRKIKKVQETAKPLVFSDKVFQL